MGLCWKEILDILTRGQAENLFGFTDKQYCYAHEFFLFKNHHGHLLFFHFLFLRECFGDPGDLLCIHSS